MDPIAHAAFGRTIAAFVVRPSTAHESGRATIVAGVLGSLSPDLDALFMPVGWDIYLRVHEIGTHSIIGTVACAALTALVVRVFSPHRSFRVLALAAWAGALSHVLLDLLSSARLRPAWPISDTVVSLPAVAMADPWMLALCVAGPVAIAVARYGAKRSGSGGSQRGPELTAARLALLALAAFVVIKGVLGAVAFRAYQVARDESGQPVVARVIEAKWASLTAWRILDRTSTSLRSWTTAAGGDAQLAFEWIIEAEDRNVARSRTLPVVRNFLRTHSLAFAVSTPGADGRTTVSWSDIRFCWEPGHPAADRLGIALHGSGAKRIACALWFGAELDSDGTPRYQFVRLGNFTQRRDLSRLG